MTSEFNKENDTLFVWKSGNLDEYRARFRNDQILKSPLKKERHEQQLSEIQNLERSFRAITPKKKTPRRNNVNTIHNTNNNNNRKQPTNASSPHTKKTNGRNATTSVKTPRKDVPDFQKKFQKQHEQTQKQLAKLKNGVVAKNVTKPVEFNFARRQTVSSNLNVDQSAFGQNKQITTLKSEAKRADQNDREAHPLQPNINFEPDQSSLDAIMSNESQQQTVTSRTSIRLPRRLTTTSLGPPIRVNRSNTAQPAFHQPSPQTIKRHFTEKMVKSGKKKEMPRNIDDSFHCVSRQLFHEQHAVNNDLDTSSYPDKHTNITSSVDHLIQAIQQSDQPSPVQRQLIEVLKGSSNKNISEEIQEHGDKIEEECGFDVRTFNALTPSTKKLLKNIDKTKKNYSIASTTVQPSHHLPICSSSMFDDDEDPELTSLISRITSQSPVRVLTHTAGRLSNVHLETNNEPIYNVHMDLESPHNRTGAENPIGRMFSTEKPLDQERKHNATTGVQRVLQFEHFERSPSLFVSLDYHNQMDVTQAVPSAFAQLGNQEDSMILSP